MRIYGLAFVTKYGLESPLLQRKSAIFARYSGEVNWLSVLLGQTLSYTNYWL